MVLLRHTESESNAGLPTFDAASIGLTEEGLAQAERIAQQWRVPPDLIVVSGFRRAQQTVAPLIRRFGETAVVVRAVHEFTYLVRPTEATTPEQRVPLIESYWARADPYECQPGAESFATFWERVRNFNTTALRCSAQQIVVVTHGFFMRAFDRYCADLEVVVDSALMRDVRTASIGRPIANGESIEYQLDSSAHAWIRAEIQVASDT